MLTKLFLFLKLMRFFNPTGYILVFFPACFGVLLNDISKLNALKFLTLFFIGSIITRGAGCVINDIWDRDIDKYVLRTKDRPLANSSLSIKEAMIFLSLLLVCSLTILLSLNRVSIYLGVLAFIMIILYPLMKRIIKMPQIFLALVFNFGSLIASSAITGRITLESLILYIACCFWTIAYDTIYGFMDIKYDKEIKIKSMSIFLEKRNYKRHLYIYYSIFCILFIVANLTNEHFNYTLVFCAYGLLIWQIQTLNILDPSNCMKRFKNNNYVGLILSLCYL